MGNLKTNVTYIYERDGDTVYAREFGANPDTRKPIGWDHPIDPRTDDGRPLHDPIMDSKLWREIRREAKTNPALQTALDRAIMIYRLSKDKPL